MVKNEKSITKPDSLGVRQSTVNHVARNDGGGEDDGNSSAYEELEAEWLGCGGGMSTGSVVTVMFIGDPGSKESIFAYCFTCNESDHRVLKCKEFLAMEVVQRHGMVRKMGACRKCLKGKHFARDCPDATLCQECDSPTHHTLLHFDTRQAMRRELGTLGRNNRDMGQARAQNPIRSTFGSKTQQETATTKFIEKVNPSGERQVNNDVMFTSMASGLASLNQDIADLGNIIKEMKSMTVLSTSNKSVAQPQLKESSVMNSSDENKQTNTYFRLITCFLADYLQQLIRINAIIDEGSTDLFGEAE
jgi:hypothetical protein